MCIDCFSCEVELAIDGSCPGCRHNQSQRKIDVFAIIFLIVGIPILVKIRYKVADFFEKHYCPSKKKSFINTLVLLVVAAAVFWIYVSIFLFNYVCSFTTVVNEHSSFFLVFVRLLIIYN